MSTSTPNRRLAAAAALTFVAALTIACGSSSSATPTPSASPTPAPSATAAPSPTPAVRLGAPITPADASTSLPMLADADHYHGPMGGFGDQVVVEITPGKGPNAETEPPGYALWDPQTGSITHLWTGEAGKPEAFWGADGDWLLTVERGGYGETIGMNDWSIYARDLATGNVIEVAQHIGSAQTPPPGTLPPNQVILHDSPNPSISGGKIVWTEAEKDAAGTITSRVLLYDIGSGATQTIAESTDSGRDAIWAPMIGSGKVAWAHDTGTGSEFVTHDLATGTERSFPVDHQPYSAAMSADGRMILWDVLGTSFDKHVLDVSSGEDRTIARYQGWGTYMNQRYLSWDTSMNGPGSAPGGLYDSQTNELRPINSTSTSATNVAHVMGNWYVWQVMPLGGQETGTDGHYYAMKLSP